MIQVKINDNNNKKEQHQYRQKRKSEMFEEGRSCLLYKRVVTSQHILNVYTYVWCCFLVV